MKYSTLFSLPNVLTLLNLCSGIGGILFLFYGHPENSFYMMLLSALFDFLDGMASRWLKIFHPLGKDLDSLSDMVSFGVLPGLMCFQYLNTQGFPAFVPFLSLLIPAFSALRLAKFNQDSRQTENFLGVPTPMNGLAWASLLYPSSGFFLQRPSYVVFFVLASSFLLLSEIPMLSFKMKNYHPAKNLIRYVFLLVSVPVLLIFSMHALSVIYWLYVLAGFWNYFNKKDF